MLWLHVYIVWLWPSDTLYERENWKSFFFLGISLLLFQDGGYLRLHLSWIIEGMQIFLFMLSFMHDILSICVTFIKFGIVMPLYKYWMCSSLPCLCMFMCFHQSNILVPSLSCIHVEINISIFCSLPTSFISWSWFSNLSGSPTLVPLLKNQR